MKRLLSGIALASLVMTGAALAQSSSQNAAQQTINERALSQDLQKAGFKDIAFVDAAYVAQAKDPSGGTVVMAINPALATASGGSGATSGSGSSSSSGNSGQGSQTQAMSQNQLKQAMERSGFKDVQVVHAAYVVNATTSEGKRVEMTIAPVQ
jgi:hypothetical protein